MFKLNNVPLLILLAFLLVFAIPSLLHFYTRALKENKRLQNNQKALFEYATFYRNKDSLSVASIQALTLTSRELKSYNESLVKDLTSLHIKLKNLQSAATSATHTQYVINTQYKDSIIYQKGKSDTIPCIDFSNKWLSLQGCNVNNVFKGTIESRDTLVQLVYRVPHRFLFFRYGVKAIRQQVMTKNPFSHLTYTQYLEVKK